MLKQMRLLAVVAALVVGGSGCVSLEGMFSSELREVVVEESGRWLETNRIALVDVEGFIVPGQGSWLVSGTTVADVKEKLERAAKDRSVVAVVLRINSPGGDATTSDLLHREVAAFKRKTGKPVVAAMLGVGASGGYYVACGADRILASPTCITGSVGVIMQFTNVEGLYRKIGLSTQVVKSGAVKDIASPTRGITAEERKILAHLNKTLYDQFVSVVKRSRPTMTSADFKFISDGRPVTAGQALKHHMVDAVGYLDDALAEARALANVRGADVILYRSRRDTNTNIYARAGDLGVLREGLDVLLRRRGPAFLYLWAPGQ